MLMGSNIYPDFANGRNDLQALNKRIKQKLIKAIVLTVDILKAKR